MLEQLTNEQLVEFDPLDLLAKIILDSTPCSLDELQEPGYPGFVLGTLSKTERKLAAAVQNLTDRANELLQTEQAVMFQGDTVDSEEAIQYDALCAHARLAYETLDASMACRLDYDTDLYVHIGPARDGLIYGCPGTCTNCQLRNKDDNFRSRSEIEESGLPN